MIAKSKVSGAVFFLIFGLFWSSLTFVFDSIIFRAAYKQIAARQYPTTSGTILNSSVSRETDGDGPSYKLAITYEYTVEGKKLVGRRYRYGSFSSSDSTWAHNTAKNLPPGKMVPVFYRPSDPSDAVLVTGLQGSDLFLFAFMTPFNAVSLAFFWLGGAALVRRWRTPLAGGARIIASPNGTVVRHSPISALGAGVAGITVTAFVSLFPVCFLAGGFDPAIRTMEVVWALILTSGLAMAIWQWARIRSGRYDILLDTRNHMLALPRTDSRTPPKRVPFAAIRGVRFETVEKGKTENGPIMVYIPTLRLTGAETPSAALPAWKSADDAKAFVSWLDDALHQHDKPVDAPVPPPKQKA